MTACQRIVFVEQEDVGSSVDNRCSFLTFRHFLPHDEPNVIVEVHFVEVWPAMQPIIVQAGSFAKTLHAPCAIVFSSCFSIVRRLWIGAFDIINWLCSFVLRNCIFDITSMLRNVGQQRSVSGLYGCGNGRLLSPLLGRQHLICELCSAAEWSLKEQRLQWNHLVACAIWGLDELQVAAMQQSTALMKLK